ncbi:hypothetical protein ABEB36_012927 [Hypothenemus hampei]|uniref:Transposase IS30-like HTH domain-containing protein n=1 Tax=Hypothenemus hampei TaxID=57062 RepID=A0ABD1E727_HYPHA
MNCNGLGRPIVRRTFLNRDEVVRAVTLFEEGYSVSSIGRKLQRSHSVISRLLSRHREFDVVTRRPYPARERITTPPWNRLQVNTIKKCWKNILNFTENSDDEDPEEDIPLSFLKERYRTETDEQLQEVVNLLNEMDSQAEFSREDIQKWNENYANDQNSNSDDNDGESDAHEDSTEAIKINSSEAVDAFNTVIRWSEENIHNVDDLLVL